jgi:hypothetical protein
MKRPNAGLRVLGDLMTTMFFAFAVVVVMMLPLIHEVTKKEDAVAPPPQGNLSIELSWPDDMDMDIDLWVKSSADNIAVGYSNKGGVVFNLLRDDVGVSYDLSSQNMEITYSRGLPDGEYIINAHMFASRQLPLPVPITVLVSHRIDDKSSTNQLFLVKTTLEGQGQEKTVARFKVVNGQYVESSFNSLQEKVRNLESSP